MNWKALYYRIVFAVFPAYRRTGGRVTHISGDLKHVTVKIPLNWKTRNYVNTLFGGSIYGAVDPIYMLMLMKLLGKEYIVWDKAAHIRFLKPGKSTLTAHFTISAEELEAIKTILQNERKVERIYDVQLFDKEEKLVARVEKTLYISKKAPKK